MILGLAQVLLSLRLQLDPRVGMVLMTLISRDGHSEADVDEMMSHDSQPILPLLYFMFSLI